MEERARTFPPVEDDPDVVRILGEYQADLEAGRPADRAAVLALRPDLAAELALCLDGLDFIHGVAPALRTVADSIPEAPASVALGDFRIVREIGRGGMGVVYEAEQLSLGRRVALKVLPFAAVLDPRHLQRFKNEAQAAANLHHEHIVPVYAVGCERGVHFYAMQLIEGMTLGEVVTQLRAATGRGEAHGTSSAASSRALATIARDRTHESGEFCRSVARLGARTARALEHAHQQGVVHRDVKPGNVMIDARGEPWITDFGLAAVQGGPAALTATALTRTGDLVGTLRYMSPELAAAGRLPVDHRTDVYSLGATLYELLTLERVFPQEDVNGVLHAVVSAEPTPPRRLNRAIPVELELILQKATSKSPAERYASAAALADDLERMLEHRPVLARRPSLARRAAKWARRHRGLVAAAVVVLLVGAAALGVGALRLAGEQRRTSEALMRAEAGRRILAMAVYDYFRESSSHGSNSAQRKPSPAMRALLERALRLHEEAGVVDDPRTLSDRGALLSALGRSDEALEVYRTVARSSPGRVSSENLADALADVGSLDEARVVLEEAIAAYGESPHGRESLGNVRARLGDPAGALAEYRRAVALDGTNARYHRKVAGTLERLGEHAEARKEYEATVLLDPGSATAQNSLGAYLLDVEGDARAALSRFERAVQLDPTSPNYHYNRGNAFYALGYYDLALMAQERAIEVLELRKKSGGLASDIRSADGIGVAAIHGNRANALAALGRFDQAVEGYARALELPASPTERRSLLLARSEVYATIGKPRESLEDLRSAQSIEPPTGPVRGRERAAMGRILVRLDRLGEAIAELEGALEDGPRTAAVLNEAAWIRAVALDPAIRDPARAVELATEAVRAAPDQGNFYNTLGVALVRAGKWRDALGALAESMRRRGGGDPYDWFFVAVAKKNLDEGKEARAWYDRAVAWLEQNGKGEDAELERFREEAAALLEARSEGEPLAEQERR